MRWRVEKGDVLGWTPSPTTTTKEKFQQNLFYGEARTAVIFVLIFNVNCVIKYRMNEMRMGLSNIIYTIHSHTETLG